MRIFHENTGSYIQALAASIGKDPASLETWCCLHLHPGEGEEITHGLAQKVKETHPELDCDIVFCADGDLLLVGRGMNPAELRSLADLLMLDAASNAEIAVYDLFLDWSRIRSLLLSKAGKEERLPGRNRSEQADFGEVDSLQEAFAEARKLRESRHPQYVMVVDDDPLTRRLVAGAFKEKYAFITAADAHEAIANYLLYAPDIVFLDINMPGIGGFAVLRQLIASDPDAYVIMFSGNSYLDNVTAALSEGASGFVAKPFKKEKLRHYIEDSAMHHHKYA